MKKYSMILGAALSLFALASCQKEVDNETNGGKIINKPGSIPFELIANINEPVASKTTLNTDWSVDWESTDVIYAVTIDEEWGKPYKDDNLAATVAEFTYDSESGKFSTTSTISDGQHTFNFLYTNGAQKSYHRGASTTFSLAANQAFDATTPTASLKVNDVLGAQLTATTPTSFADVEMSHLFTLMKVTLKNKTGDDITATKFEIIADSETKLYGIYNVNFSAAPTVSYSKNGGNTLCVNISNGAIANDGTLDVFFVMAPLSGYTGDLTLKVTDSEDNIYSKTNAVNDVTLAAGTYNTANFTCKNASTEVDYVTLDWNYAGGTQADLEAVDGVTTYGLGSDYAESHAPNRVKFDTTGDYIQVKTNTTISTVSIGYKMVGGNTTSYLNIFESVDGTSWGERIDRLTISGAQNSTGTLTTTAIFNDASRYVKIVFERGANVGIGEITIHKPSTDPVIVAPDINNVPAAGVTDESSTYQAKNFSDDVEVASVDGCVTEAIADGGEIVYSVSPNYTTTAKTGTIVLQSQADNTITKTITVNQLKSTLSVSTTEVIIPADAETATFTVTTAEFGYNAVVASTETGMNLSIYSGATGSASASPQTVTVSSTTEAPDTGDPITLGTINVYRNGNTSDSQLKEIVIKKAVDTGETGGDEEITTGTFSGDTKALSMTTSSGITITQLKGDGTDCNSTYNTVSTLRVYRANQMRFTGKTFTKIEMYYTGSYSGASWSVVAGGGTVTLDTTNKKVVWENTDGASTVTLQNSTASGTNTQLRTTKFHVIYD